LGDITRELRYI
jgi:hypothetical protein